MKSKEYAAQILAADNFTLAFAKALEDVAQEALDKASTCNMTSSMLACLREGFTKWKAVVLAVGFRENDTPEKAHALFPKYISRICPELFSLGLGAKVFLGYTPDESDHLAALQGSASLQKEMHKEMSKRLPWGL